MAGISRYGHSFARLALNDGLLASFLHLTLPLSLQVEYAVKAVENGGTAIGIRCKDGVVLAVEKIISSKLLKPGANKRIATVDRHVGIVRYIPSRKSGHCRCRCAYFLNSHLCKKRWVTLDANFLGV